VPYCIDLIGGPYLETREEVVAPSAEIGHSTPPTSDDLPKGTRANKGAELRYLPHVELVTGADPAGTVIWMHGLGADGWDFVPIVRELPLPEDLAIRFIFPHAPIRPVTLNNGMPMPAWYDIAMSDVARMPDEGGIRESQKAIEALIEREAGRGIDSKRVVLAGFSQGGAIALQTGLRHTRPLAGIVALSTYLTLEPRSTPRRPRPTSPRRSSWPTARRTR
jgi:phospholipase/carboxylesterase